MNSKNNCFRLTLDYLQKKDDDSLRFNAKILSFTHVKFTFIKKENIRLNNEDSSI